MVRKDYTPQFSDGPYEFQIKDHEDFTDGFLPPTSGEVIMYLLVLVMMMMTMAKSGLVAVPAVGITKDRADVKQLNN
jgi:hypothetical protein